MTTAHGPYHRRGGEDAPAQRRGGRSVRAPGRLPRARRQRPVPRRSPTAAPRSGCARPAARSRSSRVEGRAKELSGIGKTIEEKIVQIVEDGADRGARRARGARSRPTSSSSCTCPGLGPKTARRIWQELGVSTIDELKQAAESRAAPHARRARRRRPRRTSSRRSPRRARRSSASRCSARRSRPCGPSSRSSASIRPPTRSAKRAASRRLKEQVRDLDIIATASDPNALIDYFTQLAWVDEIVAKGKTKATVVSNEGLRFDLRVVPPESYGNLLQHFTGSKQHNVALREEAVRRKLSISEYGDPGHRDRRGAHGQHRGGAVQAARLRRGSRPSCARTWASSRPRARASSRSSSSSGDIRGDMHTHSTWSSDGKNTIEEMAREAQAPGAHVHRRHRPLALSARGPHGGPEPARSTRCRRSSGASSSSRASRRTSRRTGRSTWPTRCSPSATGSWRPSIPGSTRT